jgi:hypothetical protein
MGLTPDGGSAMTSRLGRIPATWWLQSALAGLVGGLAMALAWNIGSALAGNGFWTPLNILGLTLAASTPVTPAFGGYTVGGAFLHLLTSMCWGIVYAALLGLGFPQLTRSMVKVVASGLAFGVLAFLVMGELIAPRINPSIMVLHADTYFIGHLVFGGTTGLLLFLAARKQRLAITFGPTLVTSHHPSTVHR